MPRDIISFETLTKVQLYNLAKPHFVEKSYLLDKIAKENGVKLLWLPVAHCELNAIELIWANVKSRVALQNNTFKVNDVCRLCENAMNLVTKELWKKCVEHVRKLEDKYREKESIMAMHVDSFVIHVSDDDSDSEETFYFSSSTSE